MTDFQDVATASAAVQDATTSAQDLMTIAYAHPALGAQVARHPNAYPGLLDWLQQYGTPEAKQAIAARAVPTPPPVPARTMTDSLPPAVPTQAEAEPETSSPAVQSHVADGIADDVAVKTTGDKASALQTLQVEIDSWPDVFTDLVQGADTTRWREQAAHEFAPPLLFGQSVGSLTQTCIIPEDANVLMAFPVFVDDNPAPNSQAGLKIKFGGTARAGIVAITDQQCYLSHEMGGANPVKLVWSCPLVDVKALNELQFAFSMLSMTSVGPGYEMLVTHEGKPDRIVFRVALQPVRNAAFETRLRQALDLTGKTAAPESSIADVAPEIAQSAPAPDIMPSALSQAVVATGQGDSSSHTAPITSPTASPAPAERQGLEGAYIAKILIVGVLWVVVGIALLAGAGGARWTGALALAYAAWVLSGLGSGGWRLLLY